MSDQNTQIVETGLGRMLDQFDGSVKLRALASAYLQRVQDLEDAAWPLLGERNIETATGHRLDLLGQIVKLRRGGLSDDDYRLLLKAEFRILRSTGTYDELLDLVQLLVAMPTANYETYEQFPKSVYIRPIDHIITVDGQRVATSLQRAASATTNAWFVYSNANDNNTFRLSSQGATVETDTSDGLGNVPATISTWDYDADAYVLAGLASGDFRFNSSKPTEATQLYVHDSPNVGGDESAALNSLGNTDTLWIYSNNGSFYVYISDRTDNTGTFTFDVTVTYDSGGVPDQDDMTISSQTVGGTLSATRY